jgi:hypothetical protein
VESAFPEPDGLLGTTIAGFCGTWHSFLFYFLFFSKIDSHRKTETLSIK